MSSGGGSRVASLRRFILGGAVVVGVVATSIMLLLVSVSESVRNALNVHGEELKVEQGIADRIVGAAYGQQLAAFRYLHRPLPATLVEFRALGNSAYDEIRKYLFREMPAGSRLKVELIKEAHQDFEVAAQHAFDVAETAPRATLTPRVEKLTHRAVVLESAVRDFIRDREGQSALLRGRLEARMGKLQLGLFLTAIAMALSVVVLAELLRRRVMVPLNDLSVAVQKVGEGMETVHVAPQRYREFQELAANFDVMAERIRTTRAELELRNLELTRLLVELQRAQQELLQHEKLSAMGEMLAGLAHELNNPLAGVLGLAELLEMDLAQLPQSEAAEISTTLVQPLLREAQRARDLVRNLLHFSRVPESKLARVRLSDSINVAVGLCRHRFAEHQRTIEVDIDPDLYVIAQPQKLEHLVINLANNALDALEDSGGQGFYIHAAKMSGMVMIHFEDDGPGFLDAQRAFDPFYTTKPVGKGTGLGLSLVHRFAGEFGGSVSATNRPSGGARVTITLRDACAATRVQRSPAMQEHGPPRRTDSPVVGKRVLVVDDELTLREVQKRLLTRMGHHVVTAETGTEARRLLRDGQFDIVITDLRMPGGNGMELLAWLEREKPELASTALVVTGDIATAGEGTSYPPHRVLSKPFNRDEYESRVRSALDATRSATATAAGR